MLELCQNYCETGLICYCELFIHRVLGFWHNFPLLYNSDLENHW